MSAPPTINQRLEVPGEIWIQSQTAYRELSGRIAFVGPLSRFFGQLRVIGTSGNYTFLADSTGANRGFCVRGEDTQGELAVPTYGYSKDYVLQASADTVKAYKLEVNTSAYNTTNPYQFGNPSFTVTRAGTKDTTTTNTVIGSCSQANWKAAGEAILFTIGSNDFGYGSGFLGYYAKSSNPSDPDRRFLIGIDNGSGTKINSIVILPSGSIEVPTSLTSPTASIGALTTTTLNATGVVADTITATNYVGLPAPNVLPITLDPTNSRIGINNTAPTKAIDVVGDVLVSGEVETGTVKATTYIGLPAWDPANALPITLDPTNSRIGINQTTPTKSIDVVGDAVVSGEIAAGSLRGDAFGVGYNPGVKEGWGLYRDSSTLTLYISPLTTAGVPTPANDVSIEYSTGKVILNSLQASTELTVGSDLIKTDTTNTRVGINKATPAYTLDVGGDVNIPTGSNFMINGVPISSGGSSAITVTSPNVFTASVTAPVKPTTTLLDYITVRELPGSKLCDCTFNIAWTSSSGSSPGDGVFFIDLPSGYQFDLTKHPATSTMTTLSTTFPTGAIIPGSSISAQMTSGGVTYYVGMAIVRDATRFAVFFQQNGKYWSSAQLGFGIVSTPSTSPQFSLFGSFQFHKP